MASTVHSYYGLQTPELPFPSLLERSLSRNNVVKQIRAFAHKIEPQNVQRQQASEFKLHKALDQLREGNCDEETERYFTSLTRDLYVNYITEDLLPIYFRKLLVEMHNFDVQSKLPNNLLTFKSIDPGNSQLLDFPSEKALTLKRRCKIMLLFSLNKYLKNGYQRTFLGVVPGRKISKNRS